MYKVLIVDDEMIVRVGLKSIIHWEEHGFFIAGEANNGEEALSLCESLQPDLLLTDIKMPKMDGLALIKECSERWKSMKIVVLSAWNEFEFLQQAMRFGVKDYFLKLSFNPDDLTGILGRLKAALDEERGSREAAEWLAGGKSAISTALKEQFFRIAVRDRLNVLKPDPAMSLQTGAEPNQALFCIGGDRPYAREERSPKLQGHLLKYAVVNIIEEVLGRELRADVVELEEERFLAVVDLPAPERMELLPVLAAEIQQSLIRFLNYSVSMGISGCGDSYRDFYGLYRQCELAFGEKFYAGHRSVTRYSPQPPQPAEGAWHPVSIQEEQEMNEDLELFRFETVRERSVHWVRQARKEKIWRPDTFKNWLAELVHPWYRLLKRYGGTAEDPALPERSPSYRLKDVETADDLERWLIDYTIEMEELIRELSKGQRSREEIGRARQYVDKHYADDLSVVDVAKHIGLNATYFSHLFKKEAGEGFSEYLTRVRLSQAQRLLKDSAKPVSEIAEEVGYRDVSYFRRIFRQQLAVTPTEYRARARGEEPRA